MRPASAKPTPPSARPSTRPRRAPPRPSPIRSNRRNAPSSRRVAKAAKAKQIVDAEALTRNSVRIEAEGEAAGQPTPGSRPRPAASSRSWPRRAEGLREDRRRPAAAPKEAFRLLMLEQIGQVLSENAAKAISNIKFDKVIVWDGGNGKAGGKGNVHRRFSPGPGSAPCPPMMHMMKDIGGVADARVLRQARTRRRQARAGRRCSAREAGGPTCGQAGAPYRRQRALDEGSLDEGASAERA